MKYILTILCVCLVTFAVNGQEEWSVAHNGGKLILSGIDEVKVKAYDGNEIKISAKINRNSEDSERTKGLKAINSLGLDDNTGLGVSAVKDGANFHVTQVGQCGCGDGEGYTIMIPRSMGVEYSHSTYDGDLIRITDVTKEIVISANYTDVELDGVTGPMSIKTVYGDIEAKFDQLQQESSVSLNSVYGLVDVALPNSSKANLSLRTPYGQIYTDFDIQVETKDGMREVSAKKVSGTINSGGVDMIIKSNYENIYLRKK